MLHQLAKSPLRRLLAITLAVAISIPTAFAATGEKKLVTDYEIADGLTFTNTISDGGGGRRESFALSLDADSEVFPIALQGDGTLYGGAPITSAITLAESLGYHVLGAINSDYFSTSTGVPMGLAIENGAYISSPSEFSAIAFNGSTATLIDEPEIALTLTNDRLGADYEISHFNKNRSSTGLYLFNEHFSTVSTRTTADGWMIRMTENDDSTLTVDGTISLTVTELHPELSGALPIGEGNYILTATTTAGLSSIIEGFQVGDTVTLTTQCDNEALVDAQWASGAGDIMVADGTITDSTDWQHITGGRAPRSAMGIRADGSTVFYVADGRNTGYSAGLTQMELAEELIAEGCLWVVNMDGGGSSSIAATLPGDTAPVVQNTPSDGKNRSCATFILLVTEGDAPTKPTKLALKSDGIVVMAGNSAPLTDVVAVDALGRTMDWDLGTLSFSGADFGTLDGNVYTAGKTAGTDTIKITSSSGLTGTATVHVVNAISDFSISRADSDFPLDTLAIKMDATTQLAASANYWSRSAIHSMDGIEWETNGLCTVDSSGLLTPLGGTGAITATLGDNAYSFNLTIRNIHSDVTEAHWAYNFVSFCYDNVLVSGISPTEYGVNLPISRASFLQILYNAAGRPSVSVPAPFPDVPADKYYADAVAWAYDEGITAGANGLFLPSDSITRAQAFVMLNAARTHLGLDLSDGNLGVLRHFSDYESIPTYAAQATATLVENRLASGSNGALNPRGTLTRGEMAVLIKVFLTFDADSVIPLEPPTIFATDLSLDRSDLTLLFGESYQLTANALPLEANAPITWTTSDASIATVTDEGLVIGCYDGIGQPSATITATSGDATATCIVRCRPDDGTTELPSPEPEPEPDTEQTPDPDVEPEVTSPLVVGAGTITDAPGGLNLRAEPTTTATIVSVIDNESVVAIHDSLDGWHHITVTVDGQALTGYVSSSFVRLFAEMKVTDATVLNVRATPSTDGDILTQLKEGDIVSPIHLAEGWYQLLIIENSAIRYGYVSADYISVVE